MQASHTASRCMQKIHQPQVVRREEHVGGAHPKKIKNPEPMNSARGFLKVLHKSHTLRNNNETLK